MFPLRTDLASRARYAQGGGIQRIIPAAVSRPTNVPELEAAIEWASGRGLPITPRGAGSAMSGSAVGEGLVLDLTGFGGGSSSIAVSRLSATARVAGSVTLGDLDRTAAAAGLRFGPDPSSAAWATVAGAISTNAAGARSYRLGAMDRWVNAVLLHTAEGPLTLARGAPADAHHPIVARFQREALPLLVHHRSAVEARWPRTRKNSAGYGLDRYWRSGDLIDLVIGSEGSLGVITSAELRLEPRPARRAALRIALAHRSDLPAAIAALEAVKPTTMEFLDRSLLQVMAHQAPRAEFANLPLQAAAILLVDLEADDPGELNERIAEASALMRDLALDVRGASGGTEIDELWAIRHGASAALAAIADGRRSLQVIEDGCVPPAALADYLDAVDTACKSGGIDAVMFGHAGDGHVHVNLLPDPTEHGWLDRVREIYRAVNEAVLRLGGTPAGEHGAGRLRAGSLEALVGPAAMGCFVAIKHAFDPDGRFNPGVIIPDGHDPFDRLKVGADAQPLPEGIEADLRRIEEQRRWGESRWD